MGNWCTYTIQYKCLQFKVSIEIIDDPFLELTIDDILNCKEYKSIYEPIYARWKSIYDGPNPIHYRWFPIQSQSCILIYFYYQSNSNITVKSIQRCFNKRFHHLVHPTFKEINIECPANIPITQLCMECHTKTCDTFQYGLHTNAVHITLKHRYCSECKHPNNTSSESKHDDNIIHNINDISTHNHINTEPVYDAHKYSFQFQLFMHQSVMKHINPSLKISRHKLRLVLNEIESLHMKNSMVFINSWRYRKGLINCHCNQLKREHEDRILAVRNNCLTADHDQMHRFNFQNDEIVMNQIADLIDDGCVSPDQWIQSVQELRVSFFDPNDILKRLIKNKFPWTKKLNQKTFFKNLNLYNGKWNRAIKALQNRDCGARYSRRNSEKFAKRSETKLTKLLNMNGYDNRYITECHLQKNKHYNNNDGTPDVLFKLDKPLVLKINGETKIIYWIDFKNFCCWITTKMRYKLWQQNHKYSFMHSRRAAKLICGFMRQYMSKNNVSQGIINEIKWISRMYYTQRRTPGMFVFQLGYVENINIGNDVTIVSMEWLKNNIPSIKKTSTNKTKKLKNLTVEDEKHMKVEDYY